MGQCLGVSIASTGAYVPSRVVTNEDLASLGCDSDWIIQRTGIRERRFAEPGQSTSDLAMEAIRSCLAGTSVREKDVDLLVCATMTPDYTTPSTACVLQQRLGCIAPAFDLNAACAGFMYALVTAAHYVRSGIARNAIVVSSEVMSRAVDTKDVKTYPLFGDGAGAVLLQQKDSPEDPCGLLSYTLGSEGNTKALCVPGGGSCEPLTADSLLLGRQYLQMDGRTVFKWAVRVVEESIRDVLTTCDVSMSDVSAVVLHQANSRILDAAMESFEIPREKVIVNLDRYGNTSAASIPLALHDANQLGLLKRGENILMCGFGAGLTWGTSLVRW